jgi:hypothetical protein
MISGLWPTDSLARIVHNLQRILAQRTNADNLQTCCQLKVILCRVSQFFLVTSKQQRQVSFFVMSNKSVSSAVSNKIGQSLWKVERKIKDSGFQRYPSLQPEFWSVTEPNNPPPPNCEAGLVMSSIRRWVVVFCVYRNGFNMFIFISCTKGKMTTRVYPEVFGLSR